MKPELAYDLRHWLVEPDFASMQRQPLPMNKKQEKLATTRTEKTGLRRIKGPAGSGKSLVVAARAAQLATEKKDILVVTFNITLCHYLRDLAIRYLKNLEVQTPGCGKFINEQITWCHFHYWCKDMCLKADLENEYQQLWKKRHLNKEEYELVNINLVKLVNKALDELLDDKSLKKYDAIMVDEGQDFNINWWKILRRVRRSNNSEMLLVADETQDLYNRAKYWTDEEMKGAGFIGAWSRLNQIYRMPRELIKYLQQYAKEYLPNASINLSKSKSPVYLRDQGPVEMRWLQVSGN
ncbi:MAG: UvrD-helicase domain-containing protein [Hormoscilla sp. GM102CHS1]|nr:UvrD-helicase domain-containing protein [Hormoscilla sp. GM102CHS1]